MNCLVRGLELTLLAVKQMSVIQQFRLVIFLRWYMKMTGQTEFVGKIAL